jgi:hypothetical protein
VTAAPTTYEEIVDQVVRRLHAGGALRSGADTPWDGFLRLSDRVHASFRVPGTTITPIMRRLLFGVGLAARPRCLVVAGSYVGYAMAWLLRDRADPRCAPFVERAYAIDVDPAANRLAQGNLASLGHGGRVRFLDTDAAGALATIEEPIDLLFLDLDDPDTGKAGYVDVLLAARRRLAAGALVIGHDPCVERFASDFASYHRLVETEPWVHGPWVLPVDECGLSVAVTAAVPGELEAESSERPLEEDRRA